MAEKLRRTPQVAFYRDLGNNLRTARYAAGKNQMEAADHLDITFQQLQKYEKGTNRIPVDQLVRFAAYLEVPLQQFIAPSASDSEFQSLAIKFSGREFHTLIEAWGKIDRTVRSALLNLIIRMGGAKA